MLPIDNKSNIYWKIFNKKVPIRDLLIEYGCCNKFTRTFYCPFHLDSNTGHKSAMFDDKGNSVWCFSERKRFKSKDVIVQLLKCDPDKYTYKYFTPDVLQTTPSFRLEITPNEKSLLLKNKITARELYLKKEDQLKIIGSGNKESLFILDNIKNFLGGLNG